MRNPTPTRSDVCSLCGSADRRYGGPRKLEWDHVGGEGNNEVVGWWLCDDGCHDYVTAVQRRDGDSWKRDPNREQDVRDAWLVHGTATRLGLFNESLREDERADLDALTLRRLTRSWLIAGTGQFDDEGSYRRPGANPLANDIAAAVAARKGQQATMPEPERSPRQDLRKTVNLFRALFQIDQQLPGEPLLGPAYKSPVRTTRRLYRLASEGRLSFVVANQDLVKRMMRLLADTDLDDDPPEGFDVLCGLLRLVRDLVREVAEAESLENARLAVDALMEQWSTSPVSPNPPTYK